MPVNAARGQAPAFARRYSLEATRPSFGEIAALADVVPPGTAIYLSAVPAQSWRDLAVTTARIRAAGLEPVPHLAARRITDAAELAEFLARAHGEAEVRRVLVIAGDTAPGGPYADALALIASGVLQRAGIEEIGISGYPEGHPRIAAAMLMTAMRDKIAAALAGGLRVHMVSQFSFAPDEIIAWLRTIRAAGISAPIKVGMAGPTSIPALLRFAKRCGVNASLRGLMSGAAAGLLTGSVGPGRIIEAINAVSSALGDIAPHYFSFGGVTETARFAMERAVSAEAVAASLA